MLVILKKPQNSIMSLITITDSSLISEMKKLQAIELGHSYNGRKISSNLNLYHTEWRNKPQSGSTVVDGEPLRYNINGINALHKGVEFDVAINLSEKFTIEVSILIRRLAMDFWRHYSKL